VVTELADGTLADLIEDFRMERSKFGTRDMQRLSLQILKAVAALHSKGYVHLDIRPENILLYNGVAKLGHVGGVVPVGHQLSTMDHSVSHSVLHCAPEMARWLNQVRAGANAQLRASYALDIWSAGATLSELAIQEPLFDKEWRALENDNEVFDDELAEHMEKQFCHDLSAIKQVWFPGTMKGFGPNFVDLITRHLLVVDANERGSVKAVFSHAFLSSTSPRPNGHFSDLDAMQ